VVVSRDVMMVVGVLLIHVAGGKVTPRPSWLGKTSTVVQMATVLAAMLAFYFGVPAVPKLFAVATALFTVASGLQYLVHGVKLLNAPVGAATER
jgi:cardiolipin synthase